MTTLLSPDHLGLPPPHPVHDLTDAGRVVGWVAADSIGFLGFADEEEASHGAWVAYRTLSHTLSRRDGTRPVPIDTEPLTIERIDDREVIVASGREVAVLVRPDAESAGNAPSVGFAIRVPRPTSERAMRAKAHHVYRTLRKSGVRWALWRSDG